MQKRPPVVAVTLTPARASRAGRLGYDPYDVGAIAAYVEHLERIGVTCVIVGGGPADAGVIQARGAHALEAFTLASYLAVRTSRIGIVPRVRIGRIEPFAVARLIASLDHVSGGRAGWFPSIAVDANAARANEFIHVVEQLFDSWDADAFLRDKASGVFVDPQRVRVLDHRGEHYAVKGPLNVARSPQGVPPRISHAGVPRANGAAAALARGEIVVVDDARDLPRADKVTDGTHGRTLWRVAPFVADRLADADAAFAQASAAQRASALVGTWQSWREEVAARLEGGRVDGLLIEPPAEQATDANHVARLVAVVDGVRETSGATGHATHLLRERLGLPRAEHR